MMKRLLWNEIRNHKLLSASTVMFMAVSSLLIALSAILFTDLLGSVNALMKSARTPDYLQMHAGDIDPERVGSFADGYPGVAHWQICPFLNLENSSLVLGDRPLADNTQDNGLCVQGENFDYLLDMDGELPAVKAGQVYVPACYRSLYDLRVGDKMAIGTETLTIAGFIRDSQMNSMMASSKRFLVCRADYERMRDLGEEEYLIEFLLKEDASTDSLDVEYKKAGLYANGPTITKPLIGLMNALSDGIMILDNILLPAIQANKERKRLGKGKKALIGEAERLMRKLSISDLGQRKITEVSGGQLQRACICRSMMNHPEILFADEPTGALNQSATEEVMEALASLNREGATILMLTHDSRLASRCERILYLVDGRLQGELTLGGGTNTPPKQREERVNRWLSGMGW